jgi:hypothetical protein
MVQRSAFKAELRQRHRKMNVRRNQYIIGAIGGIVALALILFPNWYAIHPTDAALIRLIGIAWIWSPPAPPSGFETMQVEHGNMGLIIAGIVILITVAACSLLPRLSRIRG